MSQASSLDEIPITKPLFGEEELRAVQLPIESGWVVQGPHVANFEAAFSTYVGARHAVTASSCTTALHLALAALGTEAGDEVVVPAFTWISTANVVEYTGAKPVFCDIDLTTFNAALSSLESATSGRTVGLIPVHLFGLCADIEAICGLAGRRALWVVEDAACAFGARVDGRHAGTFGEAGCFSFHPRKSITTGEGGMVTTADDRVATLVRSLRDHGATRTDLERHQQSASFLLADYPHIGFNYRMTDIQGALGVAQMARADEVLDARRRRAARYDALLAEVEWLRTPTVPEGFVHGYQAYVCLFSPEEPSLENVDALHERRNALMARLEERGIATRQGTHAPILTEAYRTRYSLRLEDFPNAVLADRLSLGLPLYPQMTDAEQDRVVDELVAAFA